MFRSSRRLGSTLLLLLLVLPLAITGASYRQHTRAPIVLRVAGCFVDPYQGGQFEKIAESYHKYDPNVIVQASHGATVQQAIAGESAGKPWDIFLDCGNNDIGTLATNNDVLDLTPYIQKYHFDLNKLTGSARTLDVFNGRYYGLSYLTDCYMLLYNKTLFRKAGLDPNKPPTTIEQMQAMWKKLTLRDAHGNVTSIAWSPLYGAPDFVGTYLPIIITMFGGHLSSPDGKTITANCPQCVQALQWEADYYKTIGASTIDKFGQYYTPPVGSPQSPWLRGKIALYISGEWNPQFIQQYGDPKHFDYGVAPLPVPAAMRNKVNVAEAGGNIGFIMRKSAHPDDAFKWLMWIQNEDPTVAFANALFNVPQIKSALNDPRLSKNPQYRIFLHQAGVARISIFPNLPVSNEFATELATIEDQVLHGRMSAKAGLDKVTHDMQTLLNQRANGL